jgi:uncharacterized membrane protein YkvA (DUF1232 family)
MNIFFRISLIFKFLFDKKIPLREKWWIIIPVIYILSPVDLIPEPILGFGFIDDLVMLGYLLAVVMEKTKKYNGKNDIKEDKIIENVEYEIKDDEEEK